MPIIKLGICFELSKISNKFTSAVGELPITTMGDLVPKFPADNSIQPFSIPYAVLVNPNKSLSVIHFLAETTTLPLVFFAIDLIAAAAISVSVNIGAPSFRDLIAFSQAPSLNSKSS